MSGNEHFPRQDVSGGASDLSALEQFDSSRGGLKSNAPPIRRGKCEGETPFKVSPKPQPLGWIAAANAAVTRCQGNAATPPTLSRLSGEAKKNHSPCEKLLDTDRPRALGLRQGKKTTWLAALQPAQGDQPSGCFQITDYAPSPSNGGLAMRSRLTSGQILLRNRRHNMLCQEER
jgi:hypothetical protein